MLSDFRARGMLAVIASPVFACRQNPLDCPSLTARIPALARAVSQASTHCRGHVQKSGARCPLSAQLRRPRPRPAIYTLRRLRSSVVRLAFLPFGLTLDEEAGLLERETGKSVKELRDLSLETFRAEIAKSNDPSRRIIINFLRTPLFGRGHGHFSPVLGYLPAEDLVFVGDVNANYRPWLVPTSRLFDAQNTIDSSSHAKRGLPEVEAQ